MKRLFALLAGILPFIALILSGQSLQNLGISTADGLTVHRFILSDSINVNAENPMPVFSFELNGRYHQSDDISSVLAGTRFMMNFEESLRVTFTSFGGGHPGWRGEITFENGGFDTLEISNVLPFGENKDNVYITGKGPWDLARAWLHRPGYSPVRVILPDNAWETGYTSFSLGNNLSVASTARRGSNNGAIIKRYSTLLPPGSTITINLYGEIFTGEWQNGMKMVFRDRYLYDLYEFDNSLFEREDLKWIRSSYLIMLQFAWDRGFYDRFTGKYNYSEVLREANRRFGFLDVYGIWPTWPRLGIDQRNQWDLYDDLPGGNTQLRSFARLSRQYNTRFFIAYNPWDLSTREQNPYSGMAKIIGDVEADGVVLDTRGSSSFELQSAADSVRDGVVMYSEGMAVVRDMPGIVSGRVHNALFLAPELNLNKLIKSEFAIFRVLDVGEAILHREIAVAFFNGYGSELNMFRAGRDYQLDEDYRMLARTTMILRENSNAFLDKDWTPLINTTVDGVYVNRWRSGQKTIFTILNKNPQGVTDALFRTNRESGFHYVSLWDYNNIEPVRNGATWSLPVNADPFPVTYSGTRKEGSVDCIARLPVHLKVSVQGNNISISSDLPGRVVAWKGDPFYGGISKEFFITNDTLVKRGELFGDYEGKMVFKLYNGDELSDVSIIHLTGGVPWLISENVKSPLADKLPRNMVLVPGETINVSLTANDNFVAYPARDGSESVHVDSFLIDTYPVTNEEYYRFVTETGYFPQDTVNYLRNWVNGIYRQGQERYPVVWVSLEDARAYALWAEKRLPTEMEWQLAAQGTDGRLWPWGNEFHGTKCNNAFERPTPVDAFSKGQSQYGVYDLVGNIWQLTNDIYFNGTHYFAIIRGGSHYKPTSSWWYVQGGPQPLDKTQMLLLVSPGFDRNSTLGFRCVKDVTPGVFRD